MKSIRAKQQKEPPTNEALPFTSIDRIKHRIRFRERFLNLTKAPDALQDIYRYRNYDLFTSSMSFQEPATVKESPKMRTYKNESALQEV